MNKQSLTTFSANDIEETQPAMKIGLLATVTPDGLPHVTLLSSLMACESKKLCFGQFTEGMSKKHILDNLKVGFLIMSMNKELWSGKATYTHFSKDGPEYEYYNNVPMFRYNAYFGVHTVYYLDLVSQSGKVSLPMNQVIFAAIQTMLARTLGRKGGRQNVLNNWTRAFLNKLDNLKFLSYVGTDGYPVIIPAIQTQSWTANTPYFPPRCTKMSWKTFQLVRTCVSSVWRSRWRMYFCVENIWESAEKLESVQEW